MTEKEKTLYDNLKCGIVIFEPNDGMRIRYANKAYLAIFEGSKLDPGQEERKEILDILGREPRTGKILLSQPSKSGNKTDLTMFVSGWGDGDAFAVLVNNTEQNEKMRRLEDKALIDPLTKVYNRGAAIDKIKAVLEGKKETSECALLVLDLDNFKHINDTFGHLYGDAVISMAAGSIKNVLDEADIMGRFGGDEFFVFVDDVRREEFKQKLENIKTAVMEMRIDRSNDGDISCSIGVALGNGGRKYEDMFKEADSALYLAKQNGKNRYEFFNGDYYDGAISYAGSKDVEGETKKEHTISEVAIEIASKSKNAESAIFNIMRHAALVIELDCMQIMRYDLMDDRVDVEFEYFRELDGQFNVIKSVKKSGYYSHEDLVRFREHITKDKFFVYTPDFKEPFSLKFKDVLSYSDGHSLVYATNASLKDKKFCVFCFKNLVTGRSWKEKDFSDIMEVTKILSVYMNSSYVTTNREKGLEDKLSYMESGACTYYNFVERTGKITSYALRNNKQLAMVHFHMEGLYELGVKYGSAKQSEIADGFIGVLLRKNQENHLVVQYDYKEDSAMLMTIEEYEECKAEVLKDMEDYLQNAEIPDDCHIFLQAAVCFFIPGMGVMDALNCAKHRNLHIRAEGNVIVETEYVRMK